MSRKLSPEEKATRYPLRLFPGVKEKAQVLATANHRTLNNQLNVLLMDSLDRKEKGAA